MHLTDLVATVGDWQDRTFPQATVQSVMAHLRKEIAELDADPTNGEEMADCVMLLFGLSRKAGVNLYDEVARKFRINCERQWGEVNDEGFVEHVRD